MHDSDSKLESTCANNLNKKTSLVSVACSLFDFEGMPHVTCDCCSQIDIVQLVLTQSLLACTPRLIVNLTMMTSM